MPISDLGTTQAAHGVAQLIVILSAVGEPEGT
jgi:hypothetical protein